MVRQLSGAPPAQLLKHMFAPVTLASDLASDPVRYVPTGIIDAAGEDAYCIMRAPDNLSSAWKMRIVLSPNETSADMYMRLYVTWLKAGQAVAHSGNQVVHFATTANTLVEYDWSAFIAAVTTVEPGDTIAIRVVFDASGGAPLDTNISVYGIILTWS